MTNQHNKLEDPWAISSLVIDRTRFVCGLTEQRLKTLFCKFVGGITKLLRFFYNGNLLYVLYCVRYDQIPFITFFKLWFGKKMKQGDHWP